MYVCAGYFISSVGIIGGYNGWNSIFAVLSHGLGSVQHREPEAGAGGINYIQVSQVMSWVGIKDCPARGRLKYTESLQKIALQFFINQPADLLFSFLNTKEGEFYEYQN